MLKSELAKFLIDSIKECDDSEVVLLENKYPSVLDENQIIRQYVDIFDISCLNRISCGDTEVLTLGYTG